MKEIEQLTLEELITARDEAYNQLSNCDPEGFLFYQISLTLQKIKKHIEEELQKDRVNSVKREYEEAISILKDVVDNYIWDLDHVNGECGHYKHVDGECTDKEDILSALEFVEKLAEKSVDCFEDDISSELSCLQK